MSKGILRRVAAFSIIVLSGFAAVGTAQAAPATSHAPKASVAIRVAPDSAPVVKLGQAILEEYTVTPGGLAVIHESVQGTTQQAQAVPAKPATPVSSCKG